MKFLVNLIMCIGLTAAAVSFTACVGTRDAYKAASTPDDLAYVVTEHYAAVVHEAARLKGTGALSGSALTAVQAADNKLNPLVLKLKDAAEAYTATKTSQTAADLQAAIAKVVPLLADLARLLKSSGGTAMLLDPIIAQHPRFS